MEMPTAPTGPTRRTVLATTAWAVPAIAMTASTPAFAGSGAVTLALSTPNMQTVAAGNTTVTVTATDGNGQPVSSGAVSLTGPSGVSFSPANPTITNGTATSTMTTTDNWATPGSTLTISAVSGSSNTNQGLTVLGANALANGGNGAAYNPSTGTVEASGSSGTGSTATAVTPPTQLLLAFPSPLVSIVAGGRFTLALLQDGTVWSVGRSNEGALGDGTTSRTTWARIPTLSGVTAIGCGATSGYAILSSGQIRAWGSNNTGQLGDGTTTSSPTPVAVQNITNATRVFGNANRGACALLSTGEVRTWGYGGQGWLGNGDPNWSSSSVPVAVSGINNAVQISAGDTQLYALLTTGEIKAWGFGRNGELGNGSTQNSNVPVTVSNITNATQVAAGQARGHALLSTGELRSWGSNAAGALGNGDASNGAFSTPVAVSGITNADQVAASLSSSFAHLSTGEWKAWGNNAGYQLNDGSNTSRRTPVTFQNTSQVTKFQVGAGADSVFTYRS